VTAIASITAHCHDGKDGHMKTTFTTLQQSPSPRQQQQQQQ
jgi:hypothetical protein